MEDSITVAATMEEEPLQSSSSPSNNKPLQSTTASSSKLSKKSPSSPPSTTVRFAFSPQSRILSTSTKTPALSSNHKLQHSSTTVQQIRSQRTGNTQVHSTTGDSVTANNNSLTTVFTPILTPHPGGSSTSMVLLSPARTITETLTSLATITGQQLEEVWDRVGYNPEDRASQLSDLLMQFRDLCEQKIAEERGVAETFEQTIVEAKEEIKKTSSALKREVDPKVLDDDEANHPQTLTDELNKLEVALEALRADAKVAQDDLNECRNYIIEAHDALGIKMDPKWRDIESDLSIQQRERFHRKKAEMKQELASRMAAVVQLVRDCQQLLDDLMIEPLTEGTDLDRRIDGSLVRSKDGSFMMASKFRSESCVGISSVALEDLTKRVAELHSEKRRRKNRLQELGVDIALLWEKLQVPEEEQQAFAKSVEGLGMDTIRKGEAEMERLLVLKSSLLGKLMNDVRAEITTLWDEINATPEHRRSFSPFYVQDEDMYSDDLLDQHEGYVSTLRSRLETMKPILRLIERREEIVRERIQYDEFQKQPQRLKERGAARQLMEEEKMNKRIKRELPKLTDLLTEKLHEWRNENGIDFVYAGEVYLDSMERQEDDWNQYKAEERKKKLEEKAFVVGGGRQQSNPRPKKATTRPLGDAQTKMNIEPQQDAGHKGKRPQTKRHPPTSVHA